MKMNSKIKKKLALVLSAAMVFTTVPMSAMAAEEKIPYNWEMKAVEMGAENGEVIVNESITVTVSADITAEEAGDHLTANVATAGNLKATSSDAAKVAALKQIVKSSNINTSGTGKVAIGDIAYNEDGSEATVKVKGVSEGKVKISLKVGAKELASCDIEVKKPGVVDANPQLDGDKVTGSVGSDVVKNEADKTEGAGPITIDAYIPGAGDVKIVEVTLPADALSILSDPTQVTKTTIYTNVGEATIPADAIAKAADGSTELVFIIKKEDKTGDVQQFNVGFYDDGGEKPVDDVGRIDLSLKSNFTSGSWVKVISYHDGVDNRGKKEVKSNGYVGFYLTHLSRVDFEACDAPYSYAGAGSGVSSGSGSMAYGRTMSPQAKGPFTDVSYAIIKQFLPSYVLDGKWSKSADGSWSCLNPSTNTKYAGTWAAIYNPYSTDTAANAFGWFYFSLDGKMQTGWFTDPASGLRYYLNPNSDGTLGSMATGWKQIAGQWYYFSDVSDGTRGHLLTDTITPDGKTVDANGVWVQ